MPSAVPDSAAIHKRVDMITKSGDVEYEPIAKHLLTALRMRFGFLPPPSPGLFVARDPPRKPLEAKYLPDVIGMSGISSELAEKKELQNVLCTFFAQCSERGSVDKQLLGKVPYSANFCVTLEDLESMRNPGQPQEYYVLRRTGAGQVGGEALLLRRATDTLEILRQEWGPDIKDVVAHLVARGMPFWLATTSYEILPRAEVQTKSGEVASSPSLGTRPSGYKFDQHEYEAYKMQRDLQLLHTPRGRMAVQYGGVAARLAREVVPDEDVYRPFDEDVYDIGDCFWDGRSKLAYWYYPLAERELNVLCGAYHVLTGQVKREETSRQLVDSDQSAIYSWWPKPAAFNGGTLGLAGWTPRCEERFQKRVAYLNSGTYVPISQKNWRNNLKLDKEVVQCLKACEDIAVKIAKDVMVPVGRAG
ncbi:hypothetical protein C8R46DRAFT_1307868 [Mycena filopes]|nr:hypothetical protein C8R46DRAFT_1307868 [Mycena filopes]